MTFSKIEKMNLNNKKGEKMKFDLIKVEEKYIKDNSRLAFYFES